MFDKSKSNFLVPQFRSFSITVMLRIIPPLQGANIVHSCATILGLDLLKKPPEKTLVITGMRKTNTLEQGGSSM